MGSLSAVSSRRRRKAMMLLAFAGGVFCGVFLGMVFMSIFLEQGEAADEKVPARVTIPLDGWDREPSRGCSFTRW